jgi:hypothetical protein
MPILPPKPVRPRVEKDVQDEIRSALSGRPGVTCFRNNAGRVWISVVDFMQGGLPSFMAEKAVAVCRAKFGNLKFGLGEGSADLIGSVLIPELGIARAVAIEVKGPKGRLSEPQEKWLAYVQGLGWSAGVCTSAEEGLAVYEEGKKVTLR